MKYFSAKDAECGDTLKPSIREDALIISSILRDVEYKEVKTRLKILGNVADRREVVIRQILYEKYGGFRDNKDDNLADDTPKPKAKKRESESLVSSHEAASINPLKPQQTAVAELPSVLQVTTRASDEATLVPEKRLDMRKSLGEVNGVKGNEFDFVAYLKEVTGAPEPQIEAECELMNVSLTERPSEYAMDYLVTRLLDSGEHTKAENGHLVTEAVINKNKSPPSTVVSAESVPKSTNDIPVILNENATDLRNSLYEFTKKILENTPKLEDIIADAGMEVVPIESKKEDSRASKNKESHENGEAVEPVAGPSRVDISEPKPKKRKLCQNLVDKMMEIFPDACPDYIKDISDGAIWEELDDIMAIMLEGNYPKRALKEPSPERELDPEEQLRLLQELLPNADTNFLRTQAERYRGQTENLTAWTVEALEKHEYPTKQQSLRKQQLAAQQKQYTTEFDVKKFVELFEKPSEYFKNLKINMEGQSIHYAFAYLKNRFKRISVNIIQQEFIRARHDLRAAVAQLSVCTANLKVRRKEVLLPTDMINIPLLQLIAYMKHEEEIDAYLKDKRKKEQEARECAKLAGLMETCNCCYDEEVMPEDIATCPNGCKFCTNCVKNSTEVAFGDGKLDFNCLQDCGEKFTLQTLQRVLPPKMFSKIALKKAVQEVKAAGIEDLETCPFCDFATIPASDDKLFRCLNNDCMKESCRLCHEPSHVPLHCDEIEKDEDVKARVYIENKMTDALLRTCYKCGARFFKETGCNAMTCTCGAQMCYICNKPIKGHKHFNKRGGCPGSSDTLNVNEMNVLQAAKEAKAEVDPDKLKVDPTVDVHKHYQNRRKSLNKWGF